MARRYLERGWRWRLISHAMLEQYSTILVFAGLRTLGRLKLYSSRNSYLSEFLPRHFRHLAAILGTVAASACTLLHLCISVKGEAVASAGLAQLRAGVAKDRMQRRAPKHGIGSRLAHFGAVEQERQMSRCDVLTCLLRAIPCCFKTHGV